MSKIKQKMTKIKRELKRRLKRNFFVQPTLKVAKELLGKYLVRIIKGKRISGMITETESYLGPRDRASHAYLYKKTERNKAEYLEGGHVYIYLVYGMYWQLNFSTFKKDKPECVLIRALEPKEEIESMIKNRKLEKPKVMNEKFLRKLTGGPGVLCQSLKLDKSFYGEDLTKSKRFWLEDRGVKVKPSQIKKGPRVGIDYAGPYWSKIPWRFWINRQGEVSNFAPPSALLLRSTQQGFAKAPQKDKI